MASLLWLSGTLLGQIPTLQDVVWINSVNATPGTGSSLKKSAAGSAWNAGASSSRRIRGDGYVKFQFGLNNNYAFVGLATTDPDATYTSIDYAVEGAVSSFAVWENGTLISLPAAPSGKDYTYSSSTVFMIQRVGSKIYFWKDDWNFWVSAAPSIGSLLVDSALYQASSLVQSCMYYGPPGVEDILWESPTGTVAAAYPGQENGSTLTIGAGAGNYGAVGSKRILADGYVQFQFHDTTHQAAMGLCSARPDDALRSFDYAIQATGAGSGYQIMEAGTTTPKASGTFASGDIFRIARTGYTVAYYRNDALIYTSLVNSNSGYLLAHAGLYSASTSLVSCQCSGFVSTEKVVWGNSTNVAASYPASTSSLQKNAGAASGWNAGGVSFKRIPGDGFVRFQIGQNQVVAVGLSATDPNGVNTALEFGLQTGSNSTIQVVEGGVFHGNATTYAPGDVFVVRRSGGTIGYWQNGISRYSHAISESAPLFAAATFATPGALCSGWELYGAPVDVQWRDAAGTKITYPQPGAGSVLTKTVGTTAWDSTARGTDVFSGDGFLQFRIGTTNKAIIAGLTDQKKADVTSYTAMKYVFYLTSTGQIRIIESGTETVLGSYGVNDVFQVRRTGGVVSYRQNGVSIKTTSGSTGDLAVCNECYNTAGGLLDCQLYSGLNDSNANGIDDDWEYKFLG